MKRLILFRHAKTERDSDSGRDFDRRLTDRGQADARRIGEEVRNLGLEAELVISSPAARAAETAELAGLKPRFDQQIYEASSSSLLALAQAVDESVSSLMLIGHNPGFEQLASRLSGQYVELPTGAVAAIELPIDRWSDASDGKGKLTRFLRPKDFRQS